MSVCRIGFPWQSALPAFAFFIVHSFFFVIQYVLTLINLGLRKVLTLPRVTYVSAVVGFTGRHQAVFAQTLIISYQHCFLLQIVRNLRSSSGISKLLLTRSDHLSTPCFEKPIQSFLFDDLIYKIMIHSAKTLVGVISKTARVAFNRRRF